MTSPRDSRPDRRSDGGRRDSWTTVGRETAEEVPAISTPPAVTQSANRTKRKDEGQSNQSQPTKHLLLLFREKAISPTSLKRAPLPPLSFRRQRTQTGRQKLPGSLSCDQTDTSFDPPVLQKMPCAAPPGPEQRRLLTRHNRSMRTWAAGEQADTVLLPTLAAPGRERLRRAGRVGGGWQLTGDYWRGHALDPEEHETLKATKESTGRREHVQLGETHWNRHYTNCINHPIGPQPPGGRRQRLKWGGVAGGSIMVGVIAVISSSVGALLKYYCA